MRTYEDFENYLDGIKNQVDGLESLVTVTDWMDILELQLDRQQYPAMVVELPDVHFSQEGGPSLAFEFAFSIIQSVARDEPPAKGKKVLSELLELALKVQQVFFCDSEADEFDVKTDHTFQRIVKATADNCYGWRGFSKIKIYRSI